MSSFLEFLHKLTNLEGLTEILQWGGLIVLVAIIFAETGLLVGFFLPGDSLLVTAGFVAAAKPEILDIWQMMLALSAAAVVGDTVGYHIGKMAGTALYNRPQSRFFRRDHLLKTKAFYEKWGGMTIIMARFVPFARTFAPTVAGIGQMEYKRFLMFNVVGGISWVVSLSLVGFFLGQIPFFQKHIEKVIIAVIVISVLPVVIAAWRSRGKPAEGTDASATPSPAPAKEEKAGV